MPLRPHPATLTPAVKRRPEVLAPAGDWKSLRAALAAGADAVYLGLDEGFNARARAKNFRLDNLDALVAEVHRAGARVYVTLNTLLFEGEIPIVERLLKGIARSGVDALIVQDPAICLMAHVLCPELELHASTQMTISSAEGARFAETLGVTRVVVPRELSVTEIAAFAKNTDLELEVFVHGALCVSWSGQCLSSEAWGGRSANRGQCAQACRLPYDLMVDGEHRDLGDVKYLLSPKDLAGMRAIPALMELGVHTLKIEGRLKGPAYVTTSVTGIRTWIDAVADGNADTPTAEAKVGDALAKMMLTYSRGFSDGFLAGADHQTLVEGRFPKHRGAYLGRVERVEGHRVWVRTEARPLPVADGIVSSPLPALGGPTESNAGAASRPIEPQRGMGIGFDTGNPQRDEPGGPIFDVQRSGDGWILSFGRPGPDLRRVNEGDRVWVSGDPAVQREAEQMAASMPEGRWPVALALAGTSDQPLTVTATVRTRLHGDVVATADAASESALTPSRGKGLDDKLLRSKLGAFGGTPFCFDALDTTALEAGLHLPVRELKAIRRALVETLTPAIERRDRAIVTDTPADDVRAEQATRANTQTTTSKLVPLCRTDEQLDAIIALRAQDEGLRDRIDEVVLDWMEMVGLGKAFARAKDAGLTVTVATVRVQKPGEGGFDRRIAKLRPDGVLVRHWGALMHFLEHPEEHRPTLHGDFSLNVTNSITGHHLFGLGLDTLTASHDLDATQLFALLDGLPAVQSGVIIHHHIPTFHTEHCVYSHTLSRGRDYRTCGRPCEAHRVALRDREDLEHPVIVDVGCRNTVFNAQAQSAASLVPRLVASGVAQLRVEFVWETADDVARVLRTYDALICGELTATQSLEKLNVHEQFGVTAGTMRTLDPGVGETAGRHNG